MMAINALLELNVYLQDKLIGSIVRLAGERHLFTFHEAYLQNPHSQTLSLSFKNQEGEILTSTKSVQTRVPPFFSNLLPEGYLRDYLATQLGIKSDREFFLLAALGADLPGAIKVLPVDFDPLHPDLQKKSVLQTTKNYNSILRFSLAGIQLKFSAIEDTHGGLTIPVNGMGGSWIVKLPSLRFPRIPENEFVMLELARNIGIPVPVTRLMPVKDIQGLPKEVTSLESNTLVIERFDRTSQHARIHMEDLAQVFGLFPEKKYEKRSYANIAQVLSMETSEKDVLDFVQRLIFSTLIGNGDMHLKNWSLLYPDGITPKLSPAYDFVSTIPYLPQDRLALKFGGSRDIHQLTHEQIRRFAHKANLSFYPLQKLTEETIEKTMEAWKKSHEKSLLPSILRDSIEKHLNKVASSFSYTLYYLR